MTQEAGSHSANQRWCLPAVDGPPSLLVGRAVYTADTEADTRASHTVPSSFTVFTWKPGDRKLNTARRKCCSLMPGSDHEIFLSLFGPYLITFGTNSGLERETG